MAVLLARLRMPLIYLGMAAVAVDGFLWDPPRRPVLAAGPSLRFARYRVGDADRAGVPRNLEPFTAPR